MAIQTAVASAGNAIPLSNSRRTRYYHRYVDSARKMRVYDQIAMPMPDDDVGNFLGSAYQVNFLSHMAPGTSAISETDDITPQALRDATVTVTPTSRGEALQSSELQVAQNYLDYLPMMMDRLGQSLQETVEILASDAATQGSNVRRTVARASLDAGTSTHLADDSIFAKSQSQMLNLGIPGFETMDGSTVYAAIMTPEVFHDIRESGNVDSIGLYQSEGIHLRFELGQVGPFRLVVSPWAKVFGGAGVDNANVVATTLNTAVNPLATTITVADPTNLASWGQGWLTIGTEETGDTSQPLNERVRYVSHTGSTVTIIGQGPNGGLKYAHNSAVAVRNADSVHTIVFGGPESLAKVFWSPTGEYGEIIGPEWAGKLKQFLSAGYKWYGAYGRIAQNRLLRWEVAVSGDA